eukprot:TRINITY_DN1446_c1_g4_i1.p1 TRINITY_DN1446_c1_g4~~TRINITY_DN1446_c1_g4_i1.p1  ORF type:complete len:166 (-),score=4.40 TRINITY_DN1446_c1_g4_i1:98-595(-)
MAANPMKGMKKKEEEKKKRRNVKIKIKGFFGNGQNKNAGGLEENGEREKKKSMKQPIYSIATPMMLTMFICSFFLSFFFFFFFFNEGTLIPSAHSFEKTSIPKVIRMFIPCFFFFFFFLFSLIHPFHSVSFEKKTKLSKKKGTSEGGGTGNGRVNLQANCFLQKR